MYDACATWSPQSTSVSTAIASKYEEMSGEFEGKCASRLPLDSSIQTCLTDKAEDLKEECDIKCMSTFIMFKDDKEVGRLPGSIFRQLI